MNFAPPIWVAQAQKDVFLRMFIRKKKNRSGTTSVVVVEKRNSVYREIHTIGVGKDQTEIESLNREGLRWIESCCGNRDMFEIQAKELEEKNANINFVFLSLDRNFEAWKKGIEKHNMQTKENYWFNEGWKNNFNNYIDLNWIPRYIVVNQKSEIAKYYAITPEDPEIQKTIDELSK